MPAFAALLLIAAAPPGDREPPPNVLLILCDDLGYGDLSCYGHPVIETPRLDAFAAGGVRFTDCHAAAPVCSPSRAGLLTGRTPDRTGVYDWIPEGHVMHLPDSEVTIAELLKPAGYATCHVGKWHLNGGLLREGRNDSPQPQPGDQGFDHWFSTQNNASPSHENPVNFVRDGEPVGPLEGFSANLVAAEAVDWLKERDAADDDRPFFLFTCFHEPHEPVASPPDLIESVTDRSWNGDQAQYFANVMNVDRAVGTLLDALDELGERENTLVVFTSDNGPETLNRYPRADRSYGSPGVLRGMKLWLYEGGHRVPGIVGWPGTIAPAVIDEPVCSTDLLPTLCELAGVAPPDDRPLDGTSLVPLLTGEKFRRETPLVWLNYRGRGGPVALLRDGPHALLARRVEPGLPSGGNVNADSMRVIKQSELGRFELYDLRRDLRQYDDRASTDEARTAALAARLTEIQRAVREEGPVWEFD